MTDARQLKAARCRPDTGEMGRETRLERIVLETDRYRIVGQVTLPADGYRSRLSDLLNQEGLGFIALSNAHLMELDGSGEPEHRRFVAVARDHVEIAYEDSDE